MTEIYFYLKRRSFILLCLYDGQNPGEQLNTMERTIIRDFETSNIYISILVYTDGQNSTLV
jgi:hypothetical protein